MQELLSTTLAQGFTLAHKVVAQISTPLLQQATPPPATNADAAVTEVATAVSGSGFTINPGSGQGRSFFDISRFFSDALFLFFWSIVGAIAFALVAALAMRIFNLLTPGIDELAELRRGNIAVGIVMMGFLLTIAIVVIAVVIK